MNTNTFKKGGVARDFLQSVWVPIVWAMLLAVHIVLFSEDPSAGFFVGLFDKIMMLSCFLLYPVKALQLNDWLSSYFPFAVQFLFWWLFSYFLKIAFRRSKTRSTISK